MPLTTPVGYFAQTDQLAAEVSDTGLFYLVVPKQAAWSAFSDNIVVLLPGAVGLGTTNSDTPYSIAKDFLKERAVKVGKPIVNSLTVALADPKAAGFTQRSAALEAATIFSSFNIDNLLVQYTADDSVMFEFVQAGIYFLLEIFNDGDIAYLRRQRREEPVAYDIRREDLYTTIESMYAAIVGSNVQQ